MQLRSILLIATGIGLAGSLARAQQADAQKPSGSLPVIRTETRVVLVDAVVTDKKGNYVRDMEAKDFRVWEDNKEQNVTSFSFEAGPNAPANSQTHYLVLFFDNATMNLADQARAREAAGKFIDSNAGPNRLMAIVNFGGSLQIAQNFTADADRLKKVVSGVKFSDISPNGKVEVASTGAPPLGRAAASFGVWNEMLALSSLAKSLATVPGRKTLVLLTAGFRLTPDNMSDLTATIDACNKANVAVYPIDVRGLIASMPTGPGGTSLRFPAGYQTAPLTLAGLGFGNSFVPQRGGGGSTGGGSTGGGSSSGGSHGGSSGSSGGSSGGSKSGSSGGSSGSGSRGGTTGSGGGSTNPMMNQYATNPYVQSRMIIPPFPTDATTNQQVMYALASGTGGFVIVNTNDLLAGMEKIGKEQDQFYLLGYTPTESAEGSCHTLKVKTDRSGVTIRSRSGYCNVRPVDLLAGNSTEKDLENRVASTAPGISGVSMEAPFFYTSANTARVDVTLEIPSESIKFEKTKGKFHGAVNVLGVAYKADGTVAARFSDTVKFDLDKKKELEAFQEKPVHYENQFEIASGKYNLKVAFNSGGEQFGKVEQPLAIDSYDDKQFSISAVALSNEMHRVADVGSGLDGVLIEGHTPLVTQGMQITPSGTNHFKKTDMAALYVEVYEPGLVGQNPPVVGIQLRVLDRKTKEAKQDTGVVGVNNFLHPGNPVIPVGMKLPVNTLNPGSYVAELKAVDSTGHTSAVRTAEFDVE
jgi:VWFA-related protein